MYVKDLILFIYLIGMFLLTFFTELSKESFFIVLVALVLVLLGTNIASWFEWGKWLKEKIF